MLITRSLFLCSSKKNATAAAVQSIRTQCMSSLLPQAPQIAQIMDVDGTMKRVRYIDYNNMNKKDSSSSSNDHQQQQQHQQAPLMLLCGTAQTIESWAMHIKPLAATGRRIIIPELRCQGLVTDLSTDHMTNTAVDLAGFSFGGRLAIAFAAHEPDYVRKLSITGVPYTRPKLGEMILHSWGEFLQKKDYHAAASSFIMNGFSPVYINNNAALIAGMADIIVKNNDFNKLMKLINHTNSNSNSHSQVQNHQQQQQQQQQDDHTNSKSSTSVTNSNSNSTSSISISISAGANTNIYAASHCAGLIRCASQVIAATDDRISNYDEERRLAAHMGNVNGLSNSNGIGRSLPIVEFHTIEGSGHLSPFEKPLVWRKLLCEFLDK